MRSRPRARLGSMRVRSNSRRQKLGREALGGLAPQERQACDIFVNLSLHFELQHRHRLVMPRIPREVDEVTHALERRPIVRDVRCVQALKRIGALQALKKLGIKVQRHADGIGTLDNDELLIAAACTRRRRQPRALGHEIVVDVMCDRHIVDAADKFLDAPQNHRSYCASAPRGTTVGCTPRRSRI